MNMTNRQSILKEPIFSLTEIRNDFIYTCIYCAEIDINPRFPSKNNRDILELTLLLYLLTAGCKTRLPTESEEKN